MHISITTMQSIINTFMIDFKDIFDYFCMILLFNVKSWSKASWEALQQYVRYADLDKNTYACKRRVLYAAPFIALAGAVNYIPWMESTHTHKLCLDRLHPSFLCHHSHHVLTRLHVWPLSHWVTFTSIKPYASTHTQTR